MPLAHSLPEAFGQRHAAGFPAHLIALRQTKSGFEETARRVDVMEESSPIRVGALEITRCSDSFQATYRYDWHRAMPERRRYSHVEGGFLPLKEVAVTVAPGESGRVRYNGRFVGTDDGGWYYMLNVVNIANVEEPPPPDYFCGKLPTHEYTQLARLH